MIFFWRVLTGLLQGLALFFATRPTLTFPFENQMLVYVFLMSILYIISVVPVVVIQSLGNLRPKTLMVWVMILIPVVGGAPIYTDWDYLLFSPLTVTTPVETSSFRLFFLLGIFLWISHILVLSGDKDRSFRASYKTYFNIAWKVTLQMVLTLFFLGLFWLLLIAISEIFSSIQIKLVHQIISSHLFIFPASAMAIAAGIHLTDVNPELIQGIRAVFLSLLAWLLPLFSVLLTTFIVAFIFSGKASLLNEGVIGLLILALIVLINAVYQDGQTTVKKLLMLSARLASIILLPFTLVAIHNLLNSVSHKGWYISDVNMAGYLSVALFYSIGYLVAAIKPSSRLKYIEHCNFFGALWVLAVVAAFLTSAVNPAKISVQSQIKRLESGKINPRDFNFQYLKNKGKRYGREALLNLKNNWRGQDADWVRSQAGLALTSSQPTEPSKKENKSH